jgi:hypothetical protein
LKPLDVLSRNGNSLLGDKVDLPLIRAFQGIMTLLSGSRDHGENQPVRMTDASGRIYVMNFGEPLALEKFEYQETAVAGGTAFDIKARNLKELKILLGRVKAQYPAFDVDEAMKHAVTAHIWPDGMLKGQLQIGPSVVFPALFASASVFAAHQKHEPHPELKDYVARLDPEKVELPPDTFYFFQQPPWITAPGDVTHIVALIASAERRKMLIYFELFSSVSVAVLLPYNRTEDRTATHAVDVLTGAEVHATINEEALANVAWEATHRLGDAELYRLMQVRVGRLIGLSQELAWKAQVEMLKERALGNDEDGPLTPQKMVDAVGHVAEFVLLHWQHPLTTMTRMEEELRGFDRLCSGLEHLIVSPGRPSFRAAIAGHRDRLVSAVARERGDKSLLSTSPCRW